MVKKINIVIPMAGAGSRFQMAGYETPKPFIIFDKKMMIEHVLGSFSDKDVEFTLVIQKQFETAQSEQLKFLSEKYNLNTLSVPKLTMGAACTCIATHNIINNETPVIFADSDNIFPKQIIKDFIKNADERSLDASLLTVESQDSGYSYAKVNDNGYLIETREKEVISNTAICGIYYFKHGNLFVKAAIDLIVAQDIQRGEFYMSNVYNYLLQYTHKIGIYRIKQENFHCVGTPEQLQEYIAKRGIGK